MSKHRRAPMPASMTRRPRVKGRCRWCDQLVLGPKGEETKWMWHPACVAAFKLIHWPSETRKAVLARDNGICARCQRDSERLWKRWLDASRYEAPDQRCGPWIARDFYLRPSQERHRERLRAAAAKRLACLGKGWASGAWQHDHIRPLVEAHGDIRFWQLDNIQTLCSACHVAKGREDNARRRALRIVETPEQLTLI